MSRLSHDIRTSRVRKSPWRHVRRLVVFGVLTLLAAPFVLLFMVSSAHPLVAAAPAPSGAAAAKARRLAVALKRDIGAARERSSVTITERDANTLMGLARRGLGAFAGRVDMRATATVAAATVRVPQNPFGEFINVQLSLAPSDTGLELGEFQAGSLSVPGRAVMAALRHGLNLAAENDLGDQLFGAIYAVRMRRGAMAIDYGPVRNLLAHTEVLTQRGKDLRDELKLLGDADVTRDYFRHLCDRARKAPGSELGAYLAWAFTRAGERTRTGGDVVAENRAALLALSMVLGSRRLENLIGDIRQGRSDCDGVGRGVRVAGRNDLRQHFVISAALEVLSDAGMSFAIGEFKELTDSGRGGSGFSFVDLAADRAGLKFAELALDPNGGRAVQRHARSLGATRFFFPDTGGLEEGLGARAFEQRYGSVESATYMAKVRDIDARIARLPLFKAAR